jgi:hypothetical protein
MVTSSFEVKDLQSWSQVTLGANRNNGIAKTSQTLQTGVGKFPVEYTNRTQMHHSWHLGSPDSGLPIPKNAIIEGVRVQVTPTTSYSLSGRQADMCLALAAYSAPSLSFALNAKVYNEVPSVIAVTSTGIEPLEGAFDTGVQAWGSTVFIPAGEQIGQVEIDIERLDTPGTNPDVNVNMYSLYRNARQYAPHEFMATSDPVPYNNLTLTSGSNQPFVFDPPIASSTADRWLGFMIEGDWFSAANHATHRIKCKASQGLAQITYPVNTSGSLLFASLHPDVQYENAFSTYYYKVLDLPVLFQSDFSAQELILPYDRSFGVRLEYDDVEPMVWTADVPVSYADNKDFGATFTVAVSGTDSYEDNRLTTQLQRWIDSEWYNPDTGNEWVAIFIDRKGGTNSQIIHSTAQSAFPSATLIIDWRPRRVNVI